MEGRVDHDLEISMITGGSGGCGGGGGGVSRWNPTKEQIDMLEGLYKQGLRTPSAEQIQQITSRLRAFGNIEGKNVFYWFQNHKARQRQKQKQDHAISYSNRFLHPKPPGVCNSFYVPYPEKVLHSRHHHHQVHHQTPPPLLLPRPPKRRQPVILPEPDYGPPEKFYRPGYYSNFNNQEDFDRLIFSPGKGNEENKETLELFPMRPSGNLLSPNFSSHPAVDISSSSFPASKEIPVAGGGGDDHWAFYDFLCGNNGSCDR